MIKKIVLGLVLLSVLFLSGCLITGSGNQAGYVSAVDSHLVNGQIYMKPTLESTQEDCYIIENNDQNLMDKLEKAMLKKDRIELHYNRHFFAWGCEPNEVVTSFTTLAVVELGN